MRLSALACVPLFAAIELVVALDRLRDRDTLSLHRRGMRAAKSLPRKRGALLARGKRSLQSSLLPRVSSRPPSSKSKGRDGSRSPSPPQVPPLRPPLTPNPRSPDSNQGQHSTSGSQDTTAASKAGGRRPPSSSSARIENHANSPTGQRFSKAEISKLFPPSSDRPLHLSVDNLNKAESAGGKASSSPSPGKSRNKNWYHTPDVFDKTAPTEPRLSQQELRNLFPPSLSRPLQLSIDKPTGQPGPGQNQGQARGQNKRPAESSSDSDDPLKRSRG